MQQICDNCQYLVDLNTVFIQIQNLRDKQMRFELDLSSLTFKLKFQHMFKKYD